MVELGEILEMQRWIDDNVYGVRKEMVTKEDLLGLTKAMIHEVVELEDELDWSWFKKKSVDVEKVKEEWIDVFIFVMSFADKLGMDENEVYRMFLEKTRVNIKRHGLKE